ncbi:MAG: HAD hydrolase-like protein [Acidiferrobacterales bacterium]|nr:HAD hydrolase-like protein [Acidiferrobacterales bacterium]
MNKQYELLIFDWDGTLMDSERKIVNCFQAALRDVGLNPIDDDRIRGIIGLGLKEAMDELLPEEDEVIRVKVSDAYREHFLVKDQTEMPMFPGVVDGIKHLSNHFKLAVATGKAVPLDYLIWAGVYCLAYTTAAILLAFILFEDRDLA